MIGEMCHLPFFAGVLQGDGSPELATCDFAGAEQARRHAADTHAGEAV
jgi:hypothetical protein